MFSWFKGKEKKVMVEITDADVKRFCADYPGAKGLVDFWDNFHDDIAPRHKDYMRHMSESLFKNSIKKLRDRMSKARFLADKVDRQGNIADKDVELFEDEKKNLKLLIGDTKREIDTICHIYALNFARLKEYEKDMLGVWKEEQEKANDELVEITQELEHLKDHNGIS